jgi:hypothetical protein
MFNNNSSPNFVNCNFTKNTASCSSSADGYNNAEGGGMYNWHSTLSLSNCTLDSNTARVSAGSARGGGILNNCYITDNKASASSDSTFSAFAAGGGIYSYDSTQKLTNCKFVNNLAISSSDTGNSESRGGGIYNDRSALSLDSCNFIGNTTNSFTIKGFCNALGGGLYNINDSSTLTSCVFDNNLTIVASTTASTGRYITARGGGFYNYNNTSPPRLSKCYFVNNSSSSTSVGYNASVHGGGLYSANSFPVLDTCIFFNNTISATSINSVAIAEGGGIYNANNSTPFLTNCTLDSNAASASSTNSNAYVRGAGMFNWSSSSPTLISCVFVNNRTMSDNAEGVGMFNVNSSPTLTNCTFAKNKTLGASSKGSGMFNYNSSPSLINCVFAKNTSSSSGGGMNNVFGSSPTLINCSFIDNSTTYYGGAMYNYPNTCTPKVTNTVFFKNTAGTSGNAISNGGGASLESNSTHNASDADSAIISGAGLIDSFFIDLSAKYYKDLIVDSTDFVGVDNIWGTQDDGLELILTSPLVEAGTTTGAPSIDITGFSRANPTSIGAYEFNPSLYFKSHFGFENDICLGNSVPFTDSSIMANTYLWDFGDGNASTQQNPANTYTSAGAHKVCLTITNTKYSLTDSVCKTVNILSTSSITISPDVCDSFISAKGAVYYTATNFKDTLVNAAGCDSIITVNLTIRTKTFASISPDVCDSYTSPSGKVWTTSNSYLDTIANAANCDSIITVNLTIRNKTFASISPDVCDSYTSPSGKVWTTSNSYLDTIPNAANCDSIITVNLTIRTKTFASIAPDVCDSFISPNGTIYYASASFIDTIPNAALCDSIITINLTVKYNPIYVDTSTAGAGYGNSWTNPFKTLQDAFDYAMANEVDTIFVAEGNYCPEASPFGGTDPKDFAFYLADSNVVVLGGYDPSTGLPRNPTVLCAAISGTDTSHHVLLTGGLDTNSRFENLTITGGRAGGNSSQVKDGRTYYSYFGGGVYNNLSSPIYKNVTITGNQSEKNGGGMYNYTSAPCLENTTIESNTAGYDGGGLYNIAGSNPKLQNVTIQGNTATNNGGGVFNVSSCNPKLNTVVLKSNSAGVRGGGMYSRSSSSAVMNGVVVEANTAGYYGGGMFNWEYSSPTVNNVSFSNNTAQTGAAMYNFFQSSPTLVGATFYKNTASTSGGAMYNSSSMPTIKNSLFFANSDDIVNTSSMVFGSYNASDKGTSSKANVGSGFVNLSGQAAKDVFKDSADLDGADNVWMTTDDGLMAKLCNTAIDAGSNSNIPSGVSTDITGESRIAGAKVDMGAYESVYNNDFSLPTTAGTYYSNKTFTNGSWVYYCDCSTQSVLLALDTTGSGAVVPNTGVGLKIGNYPTISWLDTAGLVTNPKGGAMIDRRWNVSPTTQPTGTVGVKYFFTNNEYIALKDTLANHNGGLDPTTIGAVTELNMYKIVNNATFQDPHTSGLNGIILTHDATPSTTKWTYTAYGSDHEAEFKVTSFSGGGGGGGAANGPLPVELINFTATPLADHDAKLEWATASETNNSHFVIERSYDGKNFEAIDRVEGHGNSNEVLVYNYIDNTIDAIQNTVYYRLHQFDFDGESERTVVRDVNFNQLNGLNNVTIFPNPFRNEVFISTNNLEANSYTVSLTAMNGAEVMHLEVNDNLELQKLDMTELSDGMYILNIITENASQNFRIIKN